MSGLLGDPPRKSRLLPRRGLLAPADEAGWATRPSTGPSMEGRVLQGLMGTLPGMIPGIGEGMDFRDFVQSARSGSKLGMGLAAASAALPFVGGLGRLRRLPDVGKNHLRDLGEIGERVYRETDLDGAALYLKGGMDSDMTFDREFFATSPDLALGQGGNTGVLIEMDPKGLTGQVNSAKPSWEMLYEQGDAELIFRNNSQGKYRDAVRSVTITPKASGDKALRFRFQRHTIPRLLEEGWVKDVLEDGSIKLTRPSR